MSRREERLSRIRAVEHEYLVNTLSIHILGEQLKVDPSTLREQKLRPRDYHSCRDSLEATYLVRLFAEFEAGLRHAWRSLVRNTSPPTQALLDAVAGRFFIPRSWLDKAHEVRRYRNALVHESDESVAPIGIAQARGRLCRFLSRLPRDW
jgi:hypothetical protein